MGQEPTTSIIFFPYLYLYGYCLIHVSKLFALSPCQRTLLVDSDLINSSVKITPESLTRVTQQCDTLSVFHSRIGQLTWHSSTMSAANAQTLSRQRTSSSVSHQSMTEYEELNHNRSTETRFWHVKPCLAAVQEASQQLNSKITNYGRRDHHG